jgi:negative regulator of flagellin synthesis FlgM
MLEDQARGKEVFMKINGQNTSIQMDAYLKQVRKQQQNNVYQQQAKVGKTDPRDTVQLSSQAREVQEAAKALKSMPEVRQDKVQQVKMDINNGTYQVSGLKAADGMLKESFENEAVIRKINVHA